MSEADTVDAPAARSFRDCRRTVFQNHCQCLECQHKSGTGQPGHTDLLPRQGVKQTVLRRVGTWCGEAGNVEARAFLPGPRVNGST